MHPFIVRTLILTITMSPYALFHVSWTTFNLNRNQFGMVSAYVILLHHRAVNACMKSLTKINFQRMSKYH